MLTTFVNLPTLITLATMVMLTTSPLFRVLIIHVAPSYSPLLVELDISSR